MQPCRLFCKLLILACIFFGSAAGQTSDGYVGIYSDPAGAAPCVAIPPFTADTLYVLARTAGETSAGITSAEFRIEVSDTSGWLTFSFTPVPTAATVLGNPIDTDPTSNAGGGVNIIFAACQQPDADGVIPLGTMYLMNLNGNSHFLLVKRHRTSTNPTFLCPLFTLCDGPDYSKVCMTPAPSDSCSLKVGVSLRHIDIDEPLFLMAVNNEGVAPVPGAHDSISSEARAMRELAIQRGMREVEMGWYTPPEIYNLKRTMPDWMKKVSMKILDRVRLLHEKNVLVHDRRHLAVQFSTEIIPVDSLARLMVECQAQDLTNLTVEFVRDIGGELISASTKYGRLTAWVPPEQIQALAERSDIQGVMHLPVVASNTPH